MQGKTTHKREYSFLQGLLVLLLLTLPIHPANANESKQSLSMGVLPFSAPVTLYKRFTPLTDYLSKKLGIKIAIDTTHNFSSFKTKAENGHYDIILTAPHFVPGALDSGHYKLQATPTNLLTAIVVNRKDSNIASLADLKNPLIATPPRKAIISIIGEKYIQKQGIKNANFKPFNSHNSAYHAMLRHRADIAIISVNIYNKAVKDGKPLRVLGESKPFPSVAILTSKKLPAELPSKLQDALISLSSNPQGKEILQHISFPGFREATPEMYEPFRTLLKNN